MGVVGGGWGGEWGNEDEGGVEVYIGRKGSVEGGSEGTRREIRGLDRAMEISWRFGDI